MLTPAAQYSAGWLCPLMSPRSLMKAAEFLLSSSMTNRSDHCPPGFHFWWLIV